MAYLYKDLNKPGKDLLTDKFPAKAFRVKLETTTKDSGKEFKSTVTSEGSKVTGTVDGKHVYKPWGLTSKAQIGATGGIKVDLAVQDSLVEGLKVNLVGSRGDATSDPIGKLTLEFRKDKLVLDSYLTHGKDGVMVGTSGSVHVSNNVYFGGMVDVSSLPSAPKVNKVGAGLFWRTPAAIVGLTGLHGSGKLIIEPTVYLKSDKSCAYAGSFSVNAFNPSIPTFSLGTNHHTDGGVDLKYKLTSAGILSGAAVQSLGNGIDLTVGGEVDVLSFTPDSTKFGIDIAIKN